jgi:hypothetical protein
VEEEVKEEKEEAECDMAGTTSFIQANLQYSIAASRVLSRTVSVKLIDMSLIQEPWYSEGHIRGLSIPEYTLLSAGGIDRPRACILMRNKTDWILPGFSRRDLVAVLINYNEDGAEGGWLSVLHACPMILRILPHQSNWKNSCNIVRVKTSA